MAQAKDTPKKEAPKKEAQGAKKESQSASKFTPTFKTNYKEQVIPALMKEFGYTSIMQVPKLEKIVINQGMGQAVADKKLIDVAIAELTQITGQKAVQTKSKKDISNFKLRKGMPVGVRVTLRSDKMYEFMERLVAVALPRIRDFKGINEKFDGRGNYTLGITEQIIFPEIDIDKITKILGMEITFVTSTDNDAEAYALLREFGLPFKNARKAQN
jgi:large subunit ribosomal protein L5